MNKIILMLLPVIMKVFGDINGNLSFKSTSCHQHMHKRYETFSLQGFTNVSFTLLDCKVKLLSFYTILSILQPHPTKPFHCRTRGF